MSDGLTTTSCSIGSCKMASVSHAHAESHQWLMQRDITVDCQATLVLLDVHLHKGSLDRP